MLPWPWVTIWRAASREKRKNEVRLISKLSFQRADINGWHPEPITQHAPELCQVDLAGQQLVLGDDQSHQVCAEPPRGEGAHENVRVEKNLHDTSRNTSSSVR